MARREVDSIVETLAAVEHERWCHWQRYMHDRASLNIDGSLTLPSDLVSRWERLINTPYSELTEDERESDREQVRKYLPILERWLPK